MKASKHHPERDLIPVVGEPMTWEDCSTEPTLRKPIVELLYPQCDAEEATVPGSPVPWLLAR